LQREITAALFLRRKLANGSNGLEPGPGPLTGDVADAVFRTKDLAVDVTVDVCRCSQHRSHRSGIGPL